MTLLLLAVAQASQIAILYYASTAILNRRTKLYQTAPILGFASLPVIGMAQFWSVWLFKDIAPLINYLAWALTIPAIFVALRTKFIPDAALAASLWVIASIGLLLWAFGPTGVDMMIEVSRYRFRPVSTGDNTLPLDFAKALLAGPVPSPLHGDWLSSDRPPLQTGMFLAFRMPWINAEAAYQIFATVLQMAIVPSMYLMGRAFDLSRKNSGILAGVTFFAPVTIMNGVFVWPKVITGALLIGAASIHFSPLYEASKRSAWMGAAVGALCAAALLAHGAAAFTIIAFGLVALFSFRWATPSYVGALILSAAVIYTPWMAYQKFVDPPGNRLVKWHLAGVIPIDDRSASQALADAYQGMTFADHLQRTKTKIFVSLSKPLLNFSAKDHDYTTDGMFKNIFPALGALGFIGAIAVLFLPFTGAGAITALFLTNYAIWVVATFSEKGVIVHQSSYAMLYMLPFAAIFVFRRWPIALWLMLATQVAISFIYFPY